MCFYLKHVKNGSIHYVNFAEMFIIDNQRGRCIRQRKKSENMGVDLSPYFLISVNPYFLISIYPYFLISIYPHFLISTEFRANRVILRLGIIDRHFLRRICQVDRLVEFEKWEGFQGGERKR